jgi:hypothetical protein
MARLLLLLTFNGYYQHLFYIFYPLTEEFVGGHKILYGTAGMQDGGVVFAAQFRADGAERAVLDEVTAFVHGDLPGLDNLTLPGFGQQQVPG